MCEHLAVPQDFNQSNNVLFSHDQEFRQDLQVVLRGKQIVSEGKIISSEPLLHEAEENTVTAESLGIITNTPPILPSFTPEGWVRGFLKRMAPKTSVDLVALGLLKKEVHRYIEERDFQPLPHIEITHENLDKLWLDGSKYTRRQKQRYHAVLDEYLQHGMPPHLYDVGSFIKKEFYPEHKESRTISGPTNIIKCLTALAIKPIEEIVYNEHYIKHHTRPEIINMVNRIRDNYPILYETDYTSFEGTISAPIMDAVELEIFGRFLRTNNSDLYDIIRAVDLYYTKYEFTKDTYAMMSGSRKSGCLWTSLGNGLTNEILMRLLSSVNRADIDYLVEGDDGLIGTKQVLDFSVLKQLGFKIKEAPCVDINELSFCGMIFSSRDTLTCKLEDTLNGFGWTFDADYKNHHSTLRRLGLLKAKALSYYYMYPRTPIISELAQWIINGTSDIKVSQNMYDWWEWDVFGRLLTTRPEVSISPNTEDIKFASIHQNMSISAYNDFKIYLQQHPFNSDTHIMIPMDVLFQHDSSNVLDYVYC